MIKDAKIEARKAALIMNVLPTPSPLIDAPTLVVTHQWYDWYVTSLVHVKVVEDAFQILNLITMILALSDLVFNLSILSMPLCLVSAW